MMFTGSGRLGVATAALMAYSVASFTPHAAADTTLHFDLPTAPLGIFGLEFTTDFFSDVADIDNGIITDTRFHLEFNTTVAPNPFVNAANLVIDFQPPAGDLPIFTLTGTDLGWSGTGQFTADFSTDALNLPILDFPKGSELALWFMRISSNHPSNPSLGGQFTNSYIEVDVATIPAPGGLAIMLASFALAPTRRTPRRPLAA